MVRPFNVLVTALLRIGVPMGPMVLLTVPGRRSGRPRTTPVAIGQVAGRRVIGAPYGAVDWVRNLRAAGSATLTRGRHHETIAVAELPPAEAAAMWKQLLPGAPSVVRNSFQVTPSSSLEEFEREAPKHPMFVILEPASQSVAARGG
jgi:deazaflavin-dependent oxidoreductase (nitroreductase family)